MTFSSNYLRVLTHILHEGVENIQFFDVRLLIVKKSILIIYAVLLLFSLPVVSAEVIDRVVAFVDDKAITLSELEEKYKAAVKLSPNIKKEDVLNTMINRVLLLREAKKLRIEGLMKRISLRNI